MRGSAATRGRSRLNRTATELVGLEYLDAGSSTAQLVLDLPHGLRCRTEQRRRFDIDVRGPDPRESPDRGLLIQRRW
jgi:hypothetical protein